MEYGFRSLGQLPGPDGSRPEGNQSAKAEVTHESEAAGRSLARSAFYSLAPRLAGPYDASAPVGCCFLACLSHSARACGKSRSPSEPVLCFALLVSPAKKQWVGVLP